MALLQVYKDGRKVKDFEIHTHKEWIMGRSDSADLVLEGERGISRQHLKLQFVNGHWEGEVLSRYGELYQNSKKISKVKLIHGSRFEIPPFDFVFENDSASQSHSGFQSQGSTPAPEMGDLSESTQIGQVRLSPFLKICDAQGAVVQVFRLEGHVWTAGRDTSCALFIDNQKFSRRHFEIRFDDGAYVIKDLGSSNGTVVNGELISTSDWTPLRSGDVLNVVDWTLFFELRDSAFEDKLQEVSPELRNPMSYQDDPSPNPVSLARISMNQSMPPPPKSMGRPEKKKLNFVHVLIGVILIGALAFHFSETEKTDVKLAESGKKTLSPFEKLTPEQQQSIKDTYRLADRLFKEARYEMARQEVAKIHELVPVYEESKNLEKLAEVAIQSQLDQARAEAEEKQRIEMEEKIAQVTSECQKKLNPNIEMQTMDDCLMPVLALNPEHPAIAALKSQVDQLVAEKIEKNLRRADYNAKVKKQTRLYETAVGLAKAGKPLEAIPAFETVVTSKLPDPKKLKDEAKRQIASIQKDLTDSQAKYEAEADQAFKKGDLKSALLTLRKAVAINPDNESLQGRANSLLGELRKQMQVLYQEGVLEESVGEVETAKGKWRKIIELSVPEEDYFRKAKSKLKKYGDM